MIQNIRLGISPCPNDTFIFGNWINGHLPADHHVSLDSIEYLDIETLNERAFRGDFDVVKVSFHAVGALLEQYELLDSGGALGRGCGPLVVSKEAFSKTGLTDRKILIPGKWTTAALLLQIWNPGISKLEQKPFHEIMPAVQSGEADAGLIIHESRFTYPDHGLQKVVDLGEWWEESTGNPIPLGGIMVRRSLHSDMKQKIENTIRQSLMMARHDGGSSIDEYMASHAQEMDRDVRRQHIELYVNEFSLSYGESGRRAIRHLIDKARELGLISSTVLPIFLDD